MQSWEIVSAITAIIAIMITIFIHMSNSIDKKIDERLKDPKFIKMVADEVKPPFVIFDNKGSILVNQGAMRYIDDIDVKLGDKSVYPVQIIIHAKQYFSYAPLLSLLESDLANISSSRGKKYDWIYNLDYFMTNTDRKTLRYRLELIL